MLPGMRTIGLAQPKKGEDGSIDIPGTEEAGNALNKAPSTGADGTALGTEAGNKAPSAAQGN